MKKILEDFIRYVKTPTQSDELSEKTPSTDSQLVLLEMLKNELIPMCDDVTMDEFGRVYGYLKGNKDFPCIGLCAHVDTALEVTDENVNPQIIANYDGKDIKLGDSGLVLSPEEFSILSKMNGKTLVTTDGTTLLGADDKAGVAIIMEILRNVRELDVEKRHPLAILFTPDEEIGRGPEHFNKELYRAKYAYTFDGATPYLIAIENFNASSANIKVYGKSIHPGEAKGKMINASKALIYFLSCLPEEKAPELTEGHKGFNHINGISGEVEYAEASCIIRNHDLKELEIQKGEFEKAKQLTIEKFPGIKIDLKIRDQYRNMIEIINNSPEVKSKIEEVYAHLGLNFEYEPIRGGTDGATFSFMGVPCPNLGTGSYNHHGKYEFAVVEEMELMSKIGFELYKLEK